MLGAPPHSFFFFCHNWDFIVCAESWYKDISIYIQLIMAIVIISVCVLAYHSAYTVRGQLCGVTSRAQSQVAIRVQHSTFFVKPFARPNLYTIANICPRNLCIVIRFEIIIPAPNLENNFPKTALLVQKVFRHWWAICKSDQPTAYCHTICIQIVSLSNTLTVLKT